MLQLSSKPKEGVQVPYPLSRDEHAAISRYVSAITKQLHDISNLFVARYGNESNVADLALKTLASSTLLEHELMHLDRTPDPIDDILGVHH